MNKATLNSDRKKRGRCIIKGCINHFLRWTTTPVSYYSVPSAVFKHWRADRRLTWIQTIIRHNQFSSDWQPAANSVLCNLHFVGGKKSEHPLHPSYNPTLFPSQKMIAADRVRSNKQLIAEDSIESEETLSSRVSTVEHEPKKERRKKEKANDKTPTVLLLRKNFVEEPMKCEEDGASTNDFECQVEFHEYELDSGSLVNCLICNLKVENEMNCAETQVGMKKCEYNDNKVNVLECDWVEKINFAGISSVRSNNSLIDLCGLNFKQFNLVLRRIPHNSENASVTNANKLFITLVKLRQGLSYNALSIYFTMHQSLVYETCGGILSFLKEFAEGRIAWIKKEVIQNYVPEPFKPEYSNCRAMIDCIKIQLELPQNTESQKEYYTHYTNCNTFKLFIACAPNGFIMYKSKCYGGQKADGFIAQDCGFLDLVKSEDVILTNRELPNLAIAITNKGAILRKIDVTVDSEVFPLYIHMRESLNQLKHFKILSAMPIDQLEYIDDIVEICCSLVNLHFLMCVTKKEKHSM